MSEKSETNTNDSLATWAQQFVQYFLALRKIQDKTSADFLATLGNLSMQELNVLNTIGDNEPCIMSEIARGTSLSMSSITVIVDKLVKAKLVQRLRDEEDRRIVRGSLTTEGQKIYQRQIEHLNAMILKLFGSLDVAERTALLDIFRKLAQVG